MSRTSRRQFLLVAFFAFLIAGWVKAHADDGFAPMQGKITKGIAGDPTGSAGGDLTGTYPNPIIAQKGATLGQALVWDGAAWNPGTVGGSSASALQTTGANVNVSSAAPPSTGQVLTATDSTHATWQTPSGGGGGGTTAEISARLSGNLTVTNSGSPYLIGWDVENYKTGITHSNVTNKSRLTIVTTGKYHVSGVIAATCSAGSYHYLGLFINGSSFVTLDLTPGATVAGYIPFSCDVSLTASDYVELAYTTSDGTSQTLYGGAGNSLVTMHLNGSGGGGSSLSEIAVFHKAVTQSVASSSATNVTWGASDTQDALTGITHSTVTNSDRFTIATAGTYQITFYGLLTNNNGGNAIQQAELEIDLLNASSTVLDSLATSPAAQGTGTNHPQATVTGTFVCSATDYFVCIATQVSAGAGAQNIRAGTTVQIVRIR